MDKGTRDKEIKKETDKIRKLFKDLPQEKKTMCEGLIQNAGFMYVTLKELQEEIKENGALINTTSGNGFDIVKDNPSYKAYTTMISRYTVIIKQLTDMLPEGESGAGKELLAFISRRDED